MVFHLSLLKTKRMKNYSTSRLWKSQFTGKVEIKLSSASCVGLLLDLNHEGPLYLLTFLFIYFLFVSGPIHLSNICSTGHAGLFPHSLFSFGQKYHVTTLRQRKYIHVFIYLLAVNIFNHLIYLCKDVDNTLLIQFIKKTWGILYIENNTMSRQKRNYFMRLIILVNLYYLYNLICTF